MIQTKKCSFGLKIKIIAPFVHRFVFQKSESDPKRLLNSQSFQFGWKYLESLVFLCAICGCFKLWFVGPESVLLWSCADETFLKMYTMKFEGDITEILFAFGTEIGTCSRSDLHRF